MAEKLRRGAQSKTEVLLSDIWNKLATIGAGGSGATEATLVSVLHAIVASDQDIEILLVRDTVTLIVYQQITNYETGVPVVTYKDVNGTPFVPVNPMEYLDPSAVMNLLLTEALDQGLTLDDIKTAVEAIDLVNQDILTESEAINYNTLSVATLSTPVTGVPSTLLIVSVTGAASVAAGKRTVSFKNTGNADTTVNGATLKRGLGITYPELANRDVYAEIPYNALTSELTITTVG